MAAADPQSLVLDFIKTTVTTALTLDTEKLVTAAWTPAEWRGIAHDNLTVLWKGRGRKPVSNEADLVEHRIEVQTTTRGENRETIGQQLSLWAMHVENALGDRATTRSPIKSDATLRTALATLNASVFSVVIGDVSTTSEQQQGAWRYGCTVALVVTLQQRCN